MKQIILGTAFAVSFVIGSSAMIFALVMLVWNVPLQLLGIAAVLGVLLQIGVIIEGPRK